MQNLISGFIPTGLYIDHRNEVIFYFYECFDQRF